MADAAVVIQGQFGERAQPPEDFQLTDAQTKIWRDTVATEDANFFSSNAQHALLADYCRHRSTADRLSRLIDKFDNKWMNERDGMRKFKEYVHMRETETKAAAFIATKLRITNMSRFSYKTAASLGRQSNAKKAAPMPWDTDEEESD